MFEIVRRTGLVALLVYLPWSASAQTLPDWTLTQTGNNGVMVAHDGDSNAFVAGNVSNAMIGLTKISSTGVQLWQRSFDTPGVVSRSTSVAVDDAGNAIVTGMLTASGGGAAGWVVLKYDANGSLLWQDISSSALAQAVRVKFDAAGNAYVLGLMANATGAASDLVIIKYSPAGVHLWVRNYVVSATSADALAFAPGGNVVVTGRSNTAIVAATLDPNGALLGLRTIDSNGSASDVAVGPGGEIYVFGSVSDATGPAYLVVKHDAGLAQLWRNIYPARGAPARGLVDSTGNVVVTGASNTNTGPLTVVLDDWLTMKLDANGTLLWSRLYGENGAEAPFAMGIGPDDAIYLTGEGRTQVVDAFGTALLPSTLTLKYAPDGTQLWVANVPASTTQAAALMRGVGLDVGVDGGILVVSVFPQMTLRYPQSGQPNQVPVAQATASPVNGLAPLLTLFSSAGSADTDGRIATYLWEFGDGQVSTLANPSHSYAAGAYVARLTVTDTLGASATSSPIAINASAVLPVQPTALSLASTSIRGGNSTSATVTVSGKAGVTLLLSSSNPAVAQVPASVTVPVGATSVRFTVKTSKVRQNTAVTIRASANGATASASLTVRK